jgi:hypothetical protein
MGTHARSRQEKKNVLTTNHTQDEEENSNTNVDVNILAFTDEEKLGLAALLLLQIH